MEQGFERGPKQGAVDVALLRGCKVVVVYINKLVGLSYGYEPYTDYALICSHFFYEEEAHYMLQ